MPRFQYSAINKQGKNLSGIISANNNEKARQKLKALKLTIISIENVPEDLELTDDKSKYKFEATNKDQKKVIGSIEAKDMLSAFKRLVEEYELTVIKLSGITASDAEFETSIPQVQGFYKQIETLKSNIENDESQKEYFEEKKQAEFRRTLEEIIQMLRGLLNEYKNDLKPKSKDFLTKYTDHLDKIKFSQNYESTIASANKILEYFQNSNLYKDEKFKSRDKLNLKLEFMEKIGSLKKINKSSSKSSKLDKTLKNLGLKSEKNSNSGLNKILNELSLIFTSKSPTTRKLAFADTLRNLKIFFKKVFLNLNITTQNSNNTKIKKLTNSPSSINKIEKDIKLITFFLMSIYLIYYFFSVFISEKILLIKLPSIFQIYQTNFLIYFISSIILLHCAIHLRILMKKHKIQHSKVSYFLFGLLFLLILINF